MSGNRRSDATEPVWFGGARGNRRRMAATRSLDALHVRVREAESG